VSQLANKFINDAREIVKAGDIVKVKVLEVDAARKRISLTMKLDSQAAVGGAREGNAFRAPQRGERTGPQKQDAPQQASAMAAAFAKLQRQR
jgi:uncharacterized protein